MGCGAVERDLEMAQLTKKQNIWKGSGCGTVGSVVASNSRGLRFESSHQQYFIMNIFTVEKTKIKKKEAGNGPI